MEQSLFIWRIENPIQLQSCLGNKQQQTATNSNKQQQTATNSNKQQQTATSTNHQQTINYQKISTELCSAHLRHQGTMSAVLFASDRPSTNLWNCPLNGDAQPTAKLQWQTHKKNCLYTKQCGRNRVEKTTISTSTSPRTSPIHDQQLARMKHSNYGMYKTIQAAGPSRSSLLSTCSRWFFCTTASCSLSSSSCRKVLDKSITTSFTRLKLALFWMWDKNALWIVSPLFASLNRNPSCACLGSRRITAAKRFSWIAAWRVDEI